MSSSQAAVAEVVESARAMRLRELGALLLVTTPNGRVLYVDDGLMALIGRTGMPKNGYDLIAPAMAAKAAELTATLDGQDILARFPWVGREGRTVWMRLAVWRPRGMVVMAAWKEEDEARQVLSVEPGPPELFG